MAAEQLLERIASDPKIMTGKPVIRGTRLAVEFILNLLAHGATEDEILKEYEGLAQEDIQACLLFAARQDSGVPVPESHKMELDRRHERHVQSKGELLTFEQLKARIEKAKEK